MSKFDVVVKLKDGFEFRLDGLDGKILKIEEAKPVLNQICANFITGLTNNNPITVNDEDGNTRQYKYDDLASITITLLGRESK